MPIPALIPAILAVATLTTAVAVLIREIRPLIEGQNKERLNEKLRGDELPSHLGKVGEDSTEQNTE